MRRIVVIAALLVAGCGGGGSDSGGGSSTQTAGTPKETFSSKCGSCHTLADAGTEGTFGPNLDELKPDQARVLAAIKAGPGGMPAGLLEGKAAEDVAGYVASASGG